MKVLSFFAHPDDETMFCGGTLAYLARRGARVHYLSATRGEGGESGCPPLCTREELGRVREEELRCAVEALGGVSLDFLDYIDPLVSPENDLFPFTTDLEQLAGELTRKLLSLQPDVVITHGPRGEYGHPAHIIAHRGMAAAVQNLDCSPPALYAVFRERDQAQVLPGERVLVPGLILDVSAVREQKIQAALCHRTQHDLFLRNGAKRAGREVTIREVIRAEEALIQIFESSDPGKKGELPRWLEGITRK
ncbi:MAG: PIG-L deacetylase family protein [Anaerolineales bacterium]|nr:PIG-L deacetylase family protein [Anaerolineales bacterium]